MVIVPENRCQFSPRGLAVSAERHPDVADQAAASPMFGHGPVHRGRALETDDRRVDVAVAGQASRFAGCHPDADHAPVPAEHGEQIVRVDASGQAVHAEPVGRVRTACTAGSFADGDCYWNTSAVRPVRFSAVRTVRCSAEKRVDLLLVRRDFELVFSGVRAHVLVAVVDVVVPLVIFPVPPFVVARPVGILKIVLYQ